MMDNAGSMTFFNELLSNFSSNWTKDRERLLQALAASEQDNVRKVAHRLKSASSTIGAKALSSIAAEIESAATNNDLDVCSAQSQALASEFESTMLAFAQVKNKAA